MSKLYYRSFQQVNRVAIKYMLWRKPELLQGENSIRQLAEVINKARVSNALVITDKGIRKIGLMKDLLDDLDSRDVNYYIYDGTVPNPTIDNVEEAVTVYYENRCEGIIAFGGGSAMDCAKAVGARTARPDRNIPGMKGQFKVRRNIPPFFAVPTTAGTGSEGTLAAVISDTRTHEKYALNDTALIPHFAVLDPLLTINLPKDITSTTGMDALTHAVEAYIGRSNTKETKAHAIEAVELIFGNIYEACSNGNNVEARGNMQHAAYVAGLAFTRAFVGYIHAIAHTLGGFYNTPHGLANAVIMPYVLEYYGKPAHEPLAELADLIRITDETDTVGTKAGKFIAAIRQLNKDMDIPDKISGIEEKDIPAMVDRALEEANPLYPVPEILDRKDMISLYMMIRE